MAQENLEVLELKASVPAGEIQWEQSPDNIAWEPIAGATEETLKLVPMTTTYYRAKILQINCAPVFTDVKAAVIINDILFPAKLITGSVELPEEASVDPRELTVFSIYDSGPIDEEGNFSVLIADDSPENILLVTNGNEETILLSKTIGNHSDPVVSAESSALALLIMYPYLEPMSSSEKTVLLDHYRSDPEFEELEKLISGFNKTGSDLFSKNNHGINQLVKVIIERAVGNAGSGINLKTASKDPIIIGPGEERGSFRISNNTAHYFSGSITNKATGKTLDPLFTLAGKVLDGSPSIRKIARFFFGVENTMTSKEIDFEEYAAQPGEYEIAIRSGLSPDLGMANMNALSTNIYVLSSLAIGNLLDFTNIKFAGDTEQAACLSGIIKRTIEFNKYPLTFEKDKTDIIKEILIPILQSFAETFGECVKGNSQMGKFYEKLFKIFNVYEKIKNMAETGTFVKNWVSNSSALKLCRIYDSERNTFSCFNLEKIGMTNQNGIAKDKFNACQDIVTLRVKAIEDAIYYPYTSKPVKDILLNWETNGQFDAFYPNGQRSFETKTDEKGEAITEWEFSASQQPVSATVFYRIGDTKPKQAEFTSTTTNPRGELKGNEGRRTGIMGEQLTEPLIIHITDEHNPALYLDDFEISYEISGGGKLEIDLEKSVEAFRYYNWTLGNEEKEQKVRFTAERKDCNWEIAPWLFTAEAVDNEVYSVSILPEKPTIKIGDSVALTATAFTFAGPEVFVEPDQWKWEQLREDLSSIEADGNTAIVKGLEAGQVTVTATAYDINNSVELTILGEPDKIEILSGNNQFRNTAGYLPENLKVKVTDVAGNPLEGVELNWIMSSGKGRLDHAVTVSDINGETENKFFVDYSNEKHDVLVSVANNNKEISALFLETLRLIPLGPGNYWHYVGEQFSDYKKNGPDIWTYTKLGVGGIICAHSTGWNNEVCQSRYNDKNQTDFYFGGGSLVALLEMKHYFEDGDTLQIMPMANSNETKNYLKSIKIIDDKNIILQTFSPVWFVSDVDENRNPIMEFAGWNAYFHFIERGKGIIRTEMHVPKSSWIDYSYKPKSPDVPSLDDCVLQVYYNLTEFQIIE